MSSQMMIVNFTGITYQFDGDGNIIGQTGTGPDYATLAPLTIPGCVYGPAANWNVQDANGNFQQAQQQLVLIYDDSNATAIINSVQSITGSNYIYYPVSYVQNQPM